MENYFENKKANFEKLIDFGFKKEGDVFSYFENILDGQFKMQVKVSAKGVVSAEITDNSTNEPYTLHLVEGAKGTFIGAIKEKYNDILFKISQKCFSGNVFKSKYTYEIIKFIQEKYNDELEFLWEKFPDNAIVRRKDNAKWYALILTVKRNKLGFEGEEKFEIIDLRMKPEEKETLIDNERYFCGYHMNKNNWCTICLDGSVPVDEICQRVIVSYDIAGKKK